MAKVIPFRGIFYNTEKVRGSEVIAPPYDIITPGLRERLYALSPYNMVRVDAGADEEGQDKYARAARLLEDWLAGGVLKRSPRPAFYAYRVDYSVKGRPRRMTGFFGLVRLEELGKGAVYPHEETHSKPKRDRLALMTASQANTSPIFSLYHSREKAASSALARAVEAGAPDLEAEGLDGSVHRLWAVDDPGVVSEVQRDLSDKAIFIADGHHRYETALDYQRAARLRDGDPAEERPYDFVLMFLANIADDGLTVLPTHRLISRGVMEEAGRLSEHFEVGTLPGGADIIDAIEGLEHAFGLYVRGGGRYVLKYRGGDLGDVPAALRTLDVVVLQEMVFRRILGVDSYGYEMDASVAMAMVDRGQYEAAFFLNPTPVEEVEKVALASLRMPPKSTYFFPKIPAGLVMNSLKSF
ncbi:MAG: DUF1015 domain-containing protein [Thermodesulfovibrionales bacterium]